MLDSISQEVGHFGRLVMEIHHNSYWPTTLGYCGLALDHHSAVTILYYQSRSSSGLALVRVVFEAMLRAHWVYGRATDAEVDQVADAIDEISVRMVSSVRSKSRRGMR
ncbi:MAG: hypothetical protein M3Y07_10555 [Acidobacteriota bacterium]|nr:hypothetical protein [Acidobacteriota bacterium]